MPTKKEPGSQIRAFLFNMNFKKNKLNKIFNPKTLAIIGANSGEKSVGWGLLKNAIVGKSKRKIFAVNPNYNKVLNMKCFPSVLSIKEGIDLAVIAVPAKIVPQVVEECCRKKVGGMIVVSSGFAESGKAGKMLEEKIVKMARSAGIPLMGPNCLGVIRPDILLNASFAPASPRAGEIALFSQSGALVDSVIDESLGKNCGFSVLASYGNEADIALSDFLRWAEKDEKTKVIALYLEGIKEGRGIMNVFSEVSAKKPILALKAGRTEVGKKAVSSHTGSLAGEYRIYQALFKQTGVIEVDTVRDLLSLAKTLAWQPSCDNGIAIITNGGSCGVLLADYCQELGISLPKFSEKTLISLDKSGKMHPAYSRRNPLDVVGDALSGRYEAALEIILRQPDIKGLIVVQTLQIMTEPEKNAKIIIKANKKWKNKPIVAAFLGGSITASGTKLLEKNRVPNYDELKDAALAMKSLIRN